MVEIIQSKDLKPSERIVLAYLKIISKDNLSDIRQEQLHKELNLSKMTVRRALGSLIDKCYIKIVRKGKNNAYEIIK